jgi:hypothetical protein
MHAAPIASTSALADTRVASKKPAERRMYQLRPRPDEICSAPSRSTLEEQPNTTESFEMEIIDAQIHDVKPPIPVDEKYGEDVRLLVGVVLADLWSSQP